MRVRNRSKGQRDVAKSQVPSRLPIVGLDQVSESTIYPHIFGNADREVGGVLVGRISESGPLPLITGAIPAISADEQRATLTFTQDSWEHVHRTLENDFPEGEQIVGWYHSHPSFGIFLSSHDLFIHHNFFSGKSQIAVVVDPIAQTEGAFVWEGEEVVPLYEVVTPSRWEADPVVLPPPNTAGAAREPVPVEQDRPYPTAPLAIAAVVGLLLGLGISQQFFGGSEESSALEQQQMEQRFQQPQQQQTQPQPQPQAPQLTPQQQQQLDEVQKRQEDAQPEPQSQEQAEQQAQQVQGQREAQQQGK